MPKRRREPSDEDRKKAYEQKKLSEAARNRVKNAVGKEIGELPAIKDPERRAKALSSFREFCLTYGSHVFKLVFSPAHEEAIARFEAILNDGGQSALAMPRSFGKTSLMQWAVIYAVLSGKRRYVVYVGAVSDEANERLNEIKSELESNKLLAEDFPEVCLPIQALEGIPQRSRGQTLGGKRTHIAWGGRRKIVLPTVDGSLSSGSVIAVRGITAAMRGMKHTTAVEGDADAGDSIRPDLAVVDDPQTDSSAANPAQVKKRLKAINSTILQLGAGDKHIAAFILCTVIQREDLADQVLDRLKNPQWRGQRTQALPKLPTNEKKWNEYAEVWAEGLRQEDEGESANKFYRDNQKALEAGAVVTWPERMKPGDVSALQSLMHLKISDPETFWAELQQRPLSLEDATDEKLERAELIDRISFPGRDIVPQDRPRLVAFIDPNSKLLWWSVCAFGAGFSGHIVAVGTWPDQSLMYFSNREARKTLAKERPKAGRQAQVLHGLECLTNELLGREWLTESKDPLKIEKLLIDANWGQITKTVYRFSRSTPYAGIVTPSHGKYLGPTDKTIEQWPKQAGDRVGAHWRERNAKEHAKRFVLFDTNRWKSHVADRFRTAIGDPGALTIYDGRQTHHRLLLDHLTSETPIEKVVKSQRLTIWTESKGRDNDLFDCVVGCHVGASMLGIDLEVSAGGKPRKAIKAKKRRRISELSI